jgi:hypothetical protein
MVHSLKDFEWLIDIGAFHCTYCTPESRDYPGKIAKNIIICFALSRQANISGQRFTRTLWYAIIIEIVTVESYKEYCHYRFVSSVQEKALFF